MKRRLFFTWLAFFTAINLSVYATHIVGGEVTYKCLGSCGVTGTNYRITINLYIDCLNGEPPAIAQDNPAFIGIFDAAGAPGSFYYVDSITKTFEEPVPANFKNECVNNKPNTCLRKVSFVKDYCLPANNHGYKIVYVRCCRNAQILNINRPSETGATYFAHIPSVNESACNTSAVFKQYPPQIVCVNNPLFYDHSATDADGDSLSYEFCEAYPGGAPGDPKPIPTPFVPAPISQVPPNFGYKAGFSAQKPMGGNPQVQIHPTSGLITGTPTLQGRFVVAVCCHEWRNGVMINTVTREFQFVVTNCSKAVVANIPQFSSEFNTYIVQCEGKKIRFINQSTGGFSYHWDFGDSSPTSSDFEPEHEYPDTGAYVVKLVVNRGSTCPDSISRIVKVYPDYKSNFAYQGLQCPGTPLDFNDESFATFGPVVAWDWDFGDGVRSNIQHPQHAYTFGGNYGVRLISSSVKGCVDTAVKDVMIEDFRPFAGNDTIIVKDEKINFSASGGIQYRWSPPEHLNATDNSSPTGFFNDTGHFAYNVYVKSAFGCEGNDSIRIWVVAQPSLFVPSGFTPNGDGRNDLLKPLSAGYSKIRFFRVVSRWGEVLFETTKFDDGWDGTYKGQKSEIGTYFWVLGVTDRFGKEKMIKGDATLIR